MNNIYGDGKPLTTNAKVDGRIEGQRSVTLETQKRFYDLWTQRYAYIPSKSASIVFTFILGRTFSYNKTKEIISYRQISEGMETKEGDVITDGTGLCISMVKKLVKELEDLNFIKKTKRADKHKFKEASVFEVNLEFFNEEIRKAHNKDKTMAKKSKEKNTGLQHVTKNKNLIDQIGGFLDCNTHTSVSTTDSHSSILPIATPVAIGSILQYPSLTTISKDIENKPLEREPLQPIGCGHSSEEEFIKEYKENMKANYGRYYVPPVGPTAHAKRVKGQLKNLYSKLTQIEDLDILAFTKFCIVDWKYVCTNKLFFLEQHSKSSLDVSPQIGLILRFTEKFLEAYREVEVRDPDKIETVYGDAVGYRAKELQKMGYSTDYALKQALIEVELAKEKQTKTKDEVAQLERKYELEMAKMRKEQDKQLTLMRNEVRVANQKAREAKHPEIYNFSLNNMVDPELETSTPHPNQTLTD